jgi:hypothetical protein
MEKTCRMKRRVVMSAYGSERGRISAMAKPIDPRARYRFWFSLALIAAAVVVIVIVLRTSTQRSLSTLELLLFQVFVLLTSLIGAYLLGLHSKQGLEEWALKQYARGSGVRSCFLTFHEDL